MNIIPIQSLSDPRLAPYANMRDAELAQRADPLDAAAHQGLFIAEGELVVRRLISSRFAVHSILTTPTQIERLRDALEQLPAETPVFLAEQGVLNEIVGFNMHRGLLAIGLRGPALTLETLLARTGPIVVLEDLVNHDNLGGIFRNAAALGGAGVSVVLSPRCADPLYRKSIRVSMGTALCVPFTRLETWPTPLHSIHKAGFDVWGLTPSPGAVALSEACRGLRQANEEGRRVALVLGSEGPGLTDRAFGACTQLICIPMNKADPAVDSLNVAMSLGIALHCLGDT